MILTLLFIFSIGSFSGWVLELIYRRFFSSTNPERKWINPGFLVGPWLPIYGFGLTILYIMACMDLSGIHNEVLKVIVQVVMMGLNVTVIEYIAGLIFIKGMKVKLWDYSMEWGNIKGIICPKFTFFWILLSAIYYFLIHWRIEGKVDWLMSNLSFSFVIGFFYGIMVIDMAYSFRILIRIRKFAYDNDIIVKYEHLKETIRIRNEQMKEKRHFILTMYSSKEVFTEQLKHYLEKEAQETEKRIKKIQEKAEEIKEKIKL